VAPPRRPALLGKPPAVAWALLQALNLQTGHSLEDLVQQGYELRLADHGPTSYVTEHRLVQSKIVQRQADHHYATPQAYLNRVLKGIDDHPDVRHLRTTFRQIPHPNLVDVEHLFRELHDCCSPSTLPSAHAARTTTAVAVALPGILDLPGTPPLQITSAHFVRLTIITPEIVAARTGPALYQTVLLAPYRLPMQLP
jgi:hypothetical protein